MIKKIGIVLAVNLFPALVFAADPLDKTGGLLKGIQKIVTDTLIPLVFTLALLLFFWGMVKYIRSEGAGGKGEGRTLMIWGIIGLFVMSTVWGLVAFLRTELDVDETKEMKIPTIKK